MNANSLHLLRALVEQAVGPVPAGLRRKQRMREQLLAEAQAAFDRGLALGGDEAAALEEARRRHIIWVKDHACAFIHDKLRQTLLERLSEADRKGLHLQAALKLEQQDASCFFSLEYHFDAAGESPRPGRLSRLRPPG